MRKKRAVKIEEVANGEIYIPTPEDFETFTHARSIWEGLYTWLESKTGIESRDLHNRTYCADQTMKQLLELERARLRNAGIRHAEIKSALNWSNGNAGPLEQTEDYRPIVGVGVFVV